MVRRDNSLGVVAASDIYERAKLRAKEMIGIGDRDIHHAYEDLLARDDVDVVVIATPDHWHARMAGDAMRAGKDVYLEKPMSRTIPEAKAIAETARETGRVVQIGSQWVSDPAYARAREMVRDGWTGPVVMAQSGYSANHVRGVWQYSVDQEANPGTVGWPRFLGSAPAQPFSAERFFRWRKYRDFSGGIGTDLLYHRLSPRSMRSDRGSRSVSADTVGSTCLRTAKCRTLSPRRLRTETWCSTWWAAAARRLPMCRTHRLYTVSGLAFRSFPDGWRRGPTSSTRMNTASPRAGTGPAWKWTTATSKRCAQRTC